MRRLATSDYTSKKRNVFSKKVKRFGGVVSRRNTNDLDEYEDSDDVELKSASPKNVFNADDTTNLITLKSAQKKGKSKKNFTNSWEVTELSPQKRSLKPVVTTKNVETTEKERKRTFSSSSNNAVQNKDVKIRSKPKLEQKTWNRHSGAVTDSNLDTNVGPTDINKDVKTEDSDTQSAASKGPLVTTEEVEKAARALLQLIKVTTEKRRPSLFESEAEPIHMQITSIRIPRTPTRRIRYYLPHPIVTETSDICLFVPDLKKGARIDHEPTVAHYRELLDQHGVKGITQIIPVRQLLDEYSQYEMRRRLCSSYDVFLADGRIVGPINPLLGKAFHVNRKLPTPVNLQSKNLKVAIEKALSKTALTVTPRGDTTLVKIGHSHHSVEQLTENIMSVVTELRTTFPGGWQNIGGLSLKTSKSLGIPFYITMKSANSVKVPFIKSRRPKAAKPVEDELSTIPGARVTVMPSGEIVVKREALSDDSFSEVEFEEELDEEEQDSEEKEQKAEKLIKMKKESKQKPAKGDDDDDDDDDDSDNDIEAAESEYMSEWLQEFQASESVKEEVKEPLKKKRKLHKESAKRPKNAEVRKMSNTTKHEKRMKKSEGMKGSEKKKKSRKQSARSS